MVLIENFRGLSDRFAVCEKGQISTENFVVFRVRTCTCTIKYVHCDALWDIFYVSNEYMFYSMGLIVDLYGSVSIKQNCTTRNML